MQNCAFIGEMLKLDMQSTILKGAGGFSLMKWQGTKTKMDPVIDELLSGRPIQGQSQ